MSQIKLVDVLVCDDVRREADGRFSLMGVYPGARVDTLQLPTVLSQLAFVLRLTGVVGEPEISVSIEAPDGHTAKPVQRHRLTPTLGEELFVLMAAPIQLSRAGRHRLLLRDGASTTEFVFTVAHVPA